MSPLISEMSARPALDDRGQQILSAAITLRDCVGRERKARAHAMCSTFGVIRQERIDGRWKNKGLKVIVAELTSAIRSAAEEWRQDRASVPADQGSSGTRPTKKTRMDDQAPLGESAEPPPKKLRESAGDSNAEEALSTGPRSSRDRGGADPRGHSGAPKHAAAACGSSRDPTGLMLQGTSTTFQTYSVTQHQTTSPRSAGSEPTRRTPNATRCSCRSASGRTRPDTQPVNWRDKKRFP